MLCVGKYNHHELDVKEKQLHVVLRKTLCLWNNALFRKTKGNNSSCSSWCKTEEDCCRKTKSWFGIKYPKCLRTSASVELQNYGVLVRRGLNYLTKFTIFLKITGDRVKYDLKQNILSGSLNTSGTWNLPAKLVLKKCDYDLLKLFG